MRKYIVYVIIKLVGASCTSRKNWAFCLRDHQNAPRTPHTPFKQHKKRKNKNKGSTRAEEETHKNTYFW